MPSQVLPGLLPFGEWRPDVADYNGQHSKVITNVVPQGDGYGPVGQLASFSGALPAACRGLFYALKNDGSIAVFAGTSTNLYLLNNTNQQWTNVSLSGGPYTTLATTAQWQFVQFNNFVIATQVNVTPQYFDLTSSSAFANISSNGGYTGTIPNAAYCAVVNRFLVLSGIASPNVYRVQWSGLNDIFTWDNITDLSNFQDMADGGLVKGVVGGDIGTIFQDRSIRQMIFQPGSSLIFGIDRIASDDGLLFPYSFVQAGSQIFYMSSQGFRKIIPGEYPTPIGKERVDRFFISKLDPNNPQLIVAVAEPRSTRVYWTYKSQSGTAGQFDSIIVYDWALDRWALWQASGQYLAPIAQPGLTLEGVDAAYGSATAPVSSLFGSVSSTAVTLSTGAGDTWTVPNHFTAGQGINLTITSTASLPNGYTANTPYYILATSLTTAQFKLSASGGVGSLSGSAVSSTAAGSGSFAVYVPSIDNLSISSLDDISIAAEPQLGMVGTSNQVSFFTGTPMQAIMDSAEHGDNNRRIFVRGFRPITDASDSFGSLLYREVQGVASTVGAEAEINAIGFVPLRQSTRYARGKVRIPAGVTWTFASGIEPDLGQEGQR